MNHTMAALVIAATFVSSFTAGWVCKWLTDELRDDDSNPK